MTKYIRPLSRITEVVLSEKPVTALVEGRSLSVAAHEPLVKVLGGWL